MEIFNINHDVIIYPSEMGWDIIKKRLYAMHGKELADKLLALKTTTDDGFQEQLWCIIEDYNKLFYHGTECLKTMEITLINE